MTKEGYFGSREGRTKKSFNGMDKREAEAEFYGVSPRRLDGKSKVFEPEYWSRTEKVMKVSLGPGSAGNYRLPRNTGRLITQLHGSVSITRLELEHKYPHVELANMATVRREGRIIGLGSYEEHSAEIGRCLGLNP